MTVTFKPEALVSGLQQLFERIGATSRSARIVAEHLVDAEACGVSSHGVIRVGQYRRSVESGEIDPRAEPEAASRASATASLDGRSCFGQVGAQRAVELAIELAEVAGVGAVALRNCGHTGRLGAYSEYAARRGFGCIVMANAGGRGQWVAPWQGLAGRLSTNPLSIAVPGPVDPLVLDFATSMVPEGRVRTLHTAGEQLPVGCVVDHEGRPTTDPANLYGPPRGAILPFGGHKGYALAVLIDALAGGLSQAGCANAPETELAMRRDGLFLVVFNVSAFQPIDEFRAEIDRLGNYVKSSPPLPHSQEVLLPGELEARRRAEAQRCGICLEAAVWRQLEAELAAFGIALRPE